MVNLRQKMQALFGCSLKKTVILRTVNLKFDRIASDFGGIGTKKLMSRGAALQYSNLISSTHSTLSKAPIKAP